MSIYKVKLNMSEEYKIEANSHTEAELIARDKFGNDYLIDEVVTEEVKEKGTRINGILFEHGRDDFGLWEGFHLSEEDEDAICQILQKYDTKGCSVRGTRREIAKEIEKECIVLLVKEENCNYTDRGIWLAEVPFTCYGESYVMVVDNKNSSEWTVYRNLLEDNDEYERVEHDALIAFTGNANDIFPDFQIYYIRALQLLANR